MSSLLALFRSRVQVILCLEFTKVSSPRTCCYVACFSYMTPAMVWTSEWESVLLSIYSVFLFHPQNSTLGTGGRSTRTAVYSSCLLSFFTLYGLLVCCKFLSRFWSLTHVKSTGKQIKHSANGRISDWDKNLKASLKSTWCCSPSAFCPRVSVCPVVWTMCNSSVGWCSKIIHALILAPWLSFLVLASWTYHTHTHTNYFTPTQVLSTLIPIYFSVVFPDTVPENLLRAQIVWLIKRSSPSGQMNSMAS